MGILDEAGDLLGVDPWFVGGFVGLVIVSIALVIMGRLDWRPPGTTFTMFGLSVIFTTVLLWPYWVPLMLGIITLLTFFQHRATLPWRASA